MAVYDIDGNLLTSIYDINGNVLNHAYNIDGEPLVGGADLTVMTYNYMWCQNRNGLALQQAILFKYDPDIIGIQEAGNRSTREFPSVAAQSLYNYPYKELSDYYNYNGLASKLLLSDVTDNQYSVQSGSEKWTYQKCHVTVGGKTIAWFNTHLHYDSATRRYEETAELLAAANQEEYVIITGDFNMYGQDMDSADYIGIGKPFVDAGYKLANWTEQNFVMTWTDSSTATSLSEFLDACDNIIVSSNIDFLNITFDTTKLQSEYTGVIDHIPVIATIRIN